ncbi:MAG: branched-chain amino acid ABC transporter substrate-binding protein [Chloroflexota bacterium]|nr:branched-chain amino acid ABC transporter substrate-binding protein [Chloroflexota bacterium]
MPRTVLCLLTAAALCVLGCRTASKTQTLRPTESPTPASTIALNRGEPIIIGVSAALGGDQSNLGNDIADAAELAVIDRGGSLRGHPLEIRRMDDGCTDAEKAVAVARSFAKLSGLAGIIGPMCTTGAQAADGAYEGAHVVHILPAATRSDLSQQGERYLFRTAWRDDAQAAVQAGYGINDLGAKSVVLIDDGDPYGKTLADAFSGFFQAAGGRVLSRERVQRGTTDFSGIARQVKSADPPLVVFEGLNPEGALTLKALRASGFTGKFIAPDGVLNAQVLAAAGASGADGAILTGGAMPDPAFVGRFHDRFGRNPSTPFVLQSHDAVSMLIDAIDAEATEHSDGTLVIDREQLAAKLRSERFTGVTGTIQFDEHGDRHGSAAAELGLTIYRVMNGRFEVVR